MASALVTFGVAAGLLVVTVLAVYLAAKYGYFTPKSTNEQSGEERDQIQREARREEWHIPLRGWWRSWPTWYKFAVSATVIAGVAALYAFYTVVRTGAGTQALLTRETQLGIVFVVGMLAMSWIKAWSASRTAPFHIHFGGETVEEREILTNATRVNDDGHIVVTEAAPTKYLGLFARPLLVGEDSDLRDANKLPEDKIEWVLTEETVSYELGDGGYSVRTSKNGKNVIRGPSNPDYQLDSPDSMSADEVDQVKTANQQLKRRLDNQEKRMKALKDALAETERELRATKEDGRADAMDDVERIGALIQGIVPGRGAARPPENGDAEGDGEPGGGGVDPNVIGRGGGD